MYKRQKQVKLLQEQIDLAKEALLKERTEMQQYIKDLQTELKDAYEKLQKLWDTGIGATNIWLQLISDTRLLDIQTELQVQWDRAYAVSYTHLVPEQGTHGRLPECPDVGGLRAEPESPRRSRRAS